MEKKPWSKGKKAGVIGGGCCGILALGFLGLLLLGLIIGPTEEPGASAEPTTIEETEEPPAEEPTTEPEPTEDPEQTTDPEPTEEPTEEPSEEPSEEPTEEPEPSEEPTEEEEEPEEEPTEDAPAADDPQAWADEVEQSALMGSTDWQEMCDGDYSLGICWIADVSADRIGTLNVTIQLTGSDAEAKDLAEGAANAIFVTAGFEHEDLDWVVVYGADGTVIKQKKRSDYFQLD